MKGPILSPHGGIAWLLAGWAAFATAGASAAQFSAFLASPSRPALEEERNDPAIPPGIPIGSIYVVSHDIFDVSGPGEGNRLFRLANRVHIPTRPYVLERQLLFKPGDPYSAEAVAESERILRANRYLYDARIRPALNPEGTVDLEIVTRDVWTLQGGISWSRSGGKNTESIQLEDINFLGTGKEVTLSRIGTVDRTSNLVRFRDPSLLGSRAQLELSWADNSDGGRQRLRFERPFYALETRWASGIEGFLDDRVLPLYRRGEVLERFRLERDFAEVYGGLSQGRTAHGTRRLRWGFTYDRNRFEAARGFSPASLLPRDRTLAYPWIAFDSITDGFVVERDLDRMDRSEDVNLGRQVSLRLGWSSPAFGGDEERALAAAAFSQGFKPSPRSLLLTTAGLSGRYGDEGTENLLVSAKARFFARSFADSLFYASLEGQVADNLDRENQLLLGGDSGLRGYPLRFQDGDRRILLTLEQRFFTGWEVFRLAHVGGAVFFDAGRAWFADGPDGQRRELLKDIGLGLRLGSSRSARGTVVHLDVAFPLDRDRSIESVQWLVLTKETF